MGTATKKCVCGGGDTLPHHPLILMQKGRKNEKRKA